jgi:uncharacterized Tic20 family protein
MSNPDPFGSPPQQPYHVTSQPTVSPETERTLGAIAHGAPLAAMVLSAGTLGFVASLVVYLMYKDRGPFVRRHSANSLNVQLITLVYLIVSVPLMFVLVGFATALAALVFAFVVHLIGTIKAYNGEWWDPPMTPRWIS